MIIIIYKVINNFIGLLIINYDFKIKFDGDWAQSPKNFI